MESNFFGLEFRDSFYGICSVQFNPSDIISIIRQGDKNSLYIQLGRTLHLDNFKEHSITEAMFVMIHFYESTNLSDVFLYLSTNQDMCKYLKVAYQSWMMCAKYCSNSDVNNLNGNFDSGKIKFATRVRSNGDNTFKWAKRLNGETEEVKMSPQQIDHASFLPPQFQLIHEDLKMFIRDLLKRAKLQPYQVTVGLCGALSIATSTDAKQRAKSVLLQLAASPDVQLVNLHSLARFVVGNREETEKIAKIVSIVKKQETIQRVIDKKSQSVDTSTSCHIM